MMKRTYNNKNGKTTWGKCLDSEHLDNKNIHSGYESLVSCTNFFQIGSWVQAVRDVVHTELVKPLKISTRELFESLRIESGACFSASVAESPKSDRMKLCEFSCSFVTTKRTVFARQGDAAIFNRPWTPVENGTKQSRVIGSAFPSESIAARARQKAKSGDHGELSDYHNTFTYLEKEAME